MKINGYGRVCINIDRTIQTFKSLSAYMGFCFLNLTPTHSHHATIPTVTRQPLAYKELDGAVPGSRDIVTYNYISDQPDIPVETWGVESFDPEGVPSEPALLETNASSDDVQQLVCAAGSTQPSANAAAPEGSAEWSIEGAYAREVGAETVGLEIQEYLQSQEAFSYEIQEGSNTKNVVLGTPETSNTPGVVELKESAQYIGGVQEKARWGASGKDTTVGSEKNSAQRGMSAGNDGLEGLVTIEDTEYSPAIPFYD